MDALQGVLIVSGFIDPAGNYIKRALFDSEAARGAWIDQQILLDPAVSIGAYDDRDGLWATALVKSYRYDERH